MKKLKVSLLAKVVIAIAAGVVFGQFLPGGIARIFVTFNSLFGNFLSFSIPLIILGLVTPAIGELGKGAGRLLALTALIAYGSTIFSGFFTYFSSSAIFPHILPVNTELTAMENPEDFMLQPYFIVAMPPLMDVMTALLLSFTIGLGLSYINGETLRESFSDFQKIITKLNIAIFVIPLCATIHLAGSTMKITACAMAIMYMSGEPVTFTSLAGFIMMLGITMIAAPGVPGGAIMAALGLLQSMLGFNETLQALMIALYIAMDSFGTACNVTGDGAIAVVVDKIAGKQKTGTSQP